MEKQHAKFETEFTAKYRTLNAAQKQAVDQIDGPVMVIAGPGTGKTHILAMRIGNIRLKTDAHAANILCLTFTDAGAVAMRKRLLSLIGPEAHKIHIFTFHGFCNHVIQNNSEVFGGVGFEALSDLEQIEIIRALIDELPAGGLLKKIFDPYYYLDHLKQLFKVMKSENWNAETTTRLLEDYALGLESDPAFCFQRGKEKGQPNMKSIREEREKIALLKEAVLLYPGYRNALAEKKRYDYDDMILWVIEAFSKNDYLLSKYQEQYLYFLVDEYQDTNGAQNTVLSQLISYWDLPNVFIVGDDDQAIYEFQGARLKSLRDLRERYENDIHTVILKENYRSTQQILDASMALIEYNRIRIINELREFGFDKKLTAMGGDEKKNGAIPEIVAYPNIMHEYGDVANQIQSLINSGVPPAEIAVIYAQNRQAQLMMELLDRKGIPYSTKRPVDILQERLIRQIISIIRYVDDETRLPGSGEYSLFEVLHFPCWNIRSAYLAMLALEIRKYNNADEAEIGWRTAIGDREFLAANAIPDIEKILQASSVLEYLMDSKSAHSALKFFELTIAETGILAEALKSPASAGDLQLLHTFLAFVGDEMRRNKEQSLSALLKTISMMEKHQISVPLNKTITSDKGVLLTTAHSAKGLEFSHVFMVDCSEDKWNRKSGSRGQFKLPPVLTSTIGETNGEEAQRRLFYVAMTRAKTALHISYSEENRKNRVKFIDELLEQKEVDFQVREQNNESAIATHTLLLQKSRSDAEGISEDFLKEKLSEFKLSASSLNGYLQCPLGFYYEQVLGIPQAHSEYLSFGIAVHNALENTAREQKRTGRLPDLSFVIAAFRRDMTAKEYLFSKERFRQFSETGESELQFFYEKEMCNWKSSAQAESSYKLGTIENIPVTGKIDRIEYLADGSVDIIDFKTGSFKKENSKPITEKNGNGGIYRRQLIFYKLLYEQNEVNGKPVRSTRLLYTRPGTGGEFHQVDDPISDDEIKRFKELIRSTYQKIMNLEFRPGCGKKDCKWCNFEKHQIAPTDFSNPETEGLDDL